jgi:ATP-binding cassette, subfamily C (CFTR/MRP), member 1
MQTSPCLNEFQVTAATLIALWLTLVIMYASNAAVATPASLPSAIIGFVASIAIFVLSYVEHKRSVKPSLLLKIYLLLSVLFDVAQVRTLFLLRDDTRTTAVFIAALGVRVVLLLLEAQAKRSYVKILRESACRIHYRNLQSELLLVIE